MRQEFFKIIEEFLKLNERGYVESISKEKNSCGLTLEHLLGKEPDSMFFPDYNGVELKTTTRFSRYNINLFSLTFDGPSLFESNYMLETYGKIDNLLPQKKTLYANLKLNQKILVNEKYYFELKIDYEDEKIFIKTYDINMNFIEDRCFIYFDTIKSRAQVKLDKLALIYASKKKTEDNLFYRYYKIKCLKYKGFEQFLKSLEDGTVKLDIMLRSVKNEDKVSKRGNKNMNFSLVKTRINRVFDNVFTYED